MTKYELKNKNNVHANFWVKDGRVVETDPILSWIIGWSFESLQDYCLSGSYQRLKISEVV